MATQSSASTEPSAFCLNLNLLQLAVTIYRADVGKTVRGGLPLDLKELRRQAANVARIGEPMLTDAPADIRAELTDVLRAVASSATKLRTNLDRREQLELLFGPRVIPAFDAVDHCTCPK